MIIGEINLELTSNEFCQLEILNREIPQFLFLNCEKVKIEMTGLWGVKQRVDYVGEVTAEMAHEIGI